MVLLHLAALLLQLTLSRGEPEWELPALPALKGIKVRVCVCVVRPLLFPVY